MVSLKKNIVYNSVYQVLAIAMPLITAPYISRVIGVDGIGIYSYTHSISYYFGIFIFLGLQNYGTREIAIKKDNIGQLSKAFWEIYSMQIVFCVCIFSLYFLYIFTMGGQYKEYLLLQGFYVLSFGINISWLYQGLECFDFTVKSNLMVKVITIVLMFFLIKGENDLPKYVALMAISMIACQIFFWMFLTKKVTFVKPAFSGIVRHIKPNVILFIPVLAVSVYQTMDKVMLGSMKNTVLVGYYENAEKIINIPIQMIGSIGTVLMPRISNCIIEGIGANANKVQSYLLNTYKMTMIFSSAFLFGIIAITPHLIPVFFGSGYEDCVILIYALSATIFLNTIGTLVRMQILIPYGHERIFVESVCLGAIANFIGNIVLIPYIGAMGACFTTVLAEIIVSLYQFIKAEKIFSYKLYIEFQYFIFILFGLIMLFAVRMAATYTTASIMGVAIEIIVGAFVYCIFAYIYIAIFDRGLINTFVKR